MRASTPDEPRFRTLASGDLALKLIEESNAQQARGQLGEHPDGVELLTELEQSYLPRWDAEGRRTQWGFLVERGGSLVGLCLLGVSSWPDLRGYTGADILRCYRGQGITPATKPLLFHLGFGLLGLNRIETGCLVTNLPSRRSIEKTPGFVFEGVLREYARNDDGEFEDEFRYAILRREWEGLYSDVSVNCVE